MDKTINKKAIIKVSAIVVVILGIVICTILYNGIDLNLKEYQRISKINDNPDWHITMVIDTQQDELAIEEEYGIKIQDGTDYEQYSLLISNNYEINKYKMFVFDHPFTCVRGDEKCSKIAICGVSIKR